MDDLSDSPAQGAMFALLANKSVLVSFDSWAHVLTVIQCAYQIKSVGRSW